MSSRDDEWVDEQAGPVSRPYMVTGGRTQPRGARHLDLIDMVERSASQLGPMSLSPEHSRILDLCRSPISVAELSAIIGFPLGVVRVLLDDLLCVDLIEVVATGPRGGAVPNRDLLGKVLAGLRAL